MKEEFNWKEIIDLIDKRLSSSKLSTEIENRFFINKEDQRQEILLKLVKSNIQEKEIDNLNGYIHTAIKNTLFNLKRYYIIEKRKFEDSNSKTNIDDVYGVH